MVKAEHHRCPHLPDPVLEHVFLLYKAATGTCGPLREVCKDWARVVESSWQLAGVLPPSYPYEHPTRRLGGWRTATAAQWEAMVRRRAPALRRLVLTESRMDVGPRLLGPELIALRELRLVGAVPSALKAVRTLRALTSLHLDQDGVILDPNEDNSHYPLDPTPKFPIHSVLAHLGAATELRRLRVRAAGCAAVRCRHPYAFLDLSPITHLTQLAELELCGVRAGPLPPGATALTALTSVCLMVCGSAAPEPPPPPRPQRPAAGGPGTAPPAALQTYNQTAGETAAPWRRAWQEEESGSDEDEEGEEEEGASWSLAALLWPLPVLLSWVVAALRALWLHLPALWPWLQNLQRGAIGQQLPHGADVRHSAQDGLAGTLHLLPALRVLRMRQAFKVTPRDMQLPEGVLLCRSLEELHFECWNGDAPVRGGVLPELPPGCLPRVTRLQLDCRAPQQLPASWCRGPPIAELVIQAAMRLPACLEATPGTLQRLRVENCLSRIPDCICQLAGLTRLILVQNTLDPANPLPPGPYLKSLRELGLLDNMPGLRRIPAQVAGATGLTRLLLGGHKAASSQLRQRNCDAVLGQLKDLKELVLHRLGQAEGEATSRSEEQGVILLGLDEETRAVAQRLRESRGLRVRLVCCSRCMVH